MTLTEALEKLESAVNEIEQCWEAADETEREEAVERIMYVRAYLREWI